MGRTWEFSWWTRGYAYGVANETHGYVGFGKNEDGHPNDWWRYSFIEDIWEQLPNFPGIGRSRPAMIITDNKIYVGLGSANGQNFDWWEYDILNTFGHKNKFSIWKQTSPLLFFTNETPYVGFGHGDYIDNNINIYNDFYKYDVSLDIGYN